ncbi:MAG: IgGFc-binding protein [Deltaproteobacteria bacterium]|nr:IgGFc-binding protein [Deltaproteobacteria bacterium]
MTRKFLVIPAALLFAAALSCESGADTTTGDDDNGADADGDTDSDADSDADSDTDTGALGTCEPGEVWCLGNFVSVCNAQGALWDKTEDCATQGLICAAGKCSDFTQQCADAINERSYIGCDYWATTLSNIELNWTPATNAYAQKPFYYAIAVANDGADNAEVTVTDGATINNNYTVPGGQMIIIEDLPWKMNIKNPGDIQKNTWATRQVANAAYHLTSTRPVTAYQFNPLHYSAGTNVYSYSNDASLLLPSHVYLDEYVAMARPTMKVKTASAGMIRPGFVAIVGTGDGPSTVEITSSAFTFKSDAKSSASYPALQPGGTMTATLNPYDVLQILSSAEQACTGGKVCQAGYTCCNTPPQYDLTGTIIKVTSGPSPAVFAGTTMSFVPFNKWAADHLEEQMFPLKTWGTHYICARNITQKPAEPTVWRVLSGSNGNPITFTPASAHAGVTLNKGEYVEFESLADFEIKGEGRISVGQFMVGQNYTSDVNPPKNGDPSMSLGVPVEQYRTSYTFLAPTTYVFNYLTVVHKTGTFPQLDGAPVAGDTVGVTAEYSRTNLTISAGIHKIKSTEAFGIQVYGVGTYTSYMYPGGLDLKRVDTPVD